MNVQTETEPSVSTQLAIERTSLAHDRTLMAWIRTATSLISFGFALYKFFQLEFEGRLTHGQLLGPREFATLLIFVGLFALAVSTVQYRWDRKRMRAQFPGIPIPGSMAVVVAALISVLGIAALVAVIVRM